MEQVNFQPVAQGHEVVVKHDGVLQVAPYLHSLLILPGPLDRPEHQHNLIFVENFHLLGCQSILLAYY